MIEQLEDITAPDQRESLMKRFSRKVVAHVVNMNFTIQQSAIKNFNEHGNLAEVKEIFEPAPRRDEVKPIITKQTCVKQTQTFETSIIVS